MSLSIYLYFAGNCAEAFEHYKQVFNAREISRQTYEHAPAELFGPGIEKKWIMHTTIQIGDTILMGSDWASGEQPFVPGNNFAVTYKPGSREQADRLFPKLAEGGEITMALQETFWGSYFGQCNDRFGIRWMFNCPLSAAEPDHSSTPSLE